MRRISIPLLLIGALAVTSLGQETDQTKPAKRERAVRNAAECRGAEQGQIAQKLQKQIDELRTAHQELIGDLRTLRDGGQGEGHRDRRPDRQAHRPAAAELPGEGPAVGAAATADAEGSQGACRQHEKPNSKAGAPQLRGQQLRRQDCETRRLQGQDRRARMAQSGLSLRAVPLRQGRHDDRPGQEV